MRRVLVLLAALAGAFVVGVLVFNRILMPRFVQHGAVVTVPELVGLGLEEARAVCTGLGLQLREEDRRHAAGVPNDQVLSQIPNAGGVVKPGRVVRVHLSLGTEEVSIPDVRGLTLRQATLQLENAHLSVGRISKVYARQDADAEGQVVQAMRPRPGEPVTSGGKVDLVVAASSQPEPFLVPDFGGRSLEEARKQIEAQGFRVGRITYRSKAGSYPGTVLEHFPAAGALILRGETIDLVASTPD